MGVRQRAGPWEPVMKVLGTTTAHVRSRRGACSPRTLTWVYTTGILTGLKPGAAGQAAQTRVLDIFTPLVAANFPL